MESEFLSVGRCPLEVHKDIIQYVTDDPISLKNLSHAKLAAARDYRLGPKGTTMTEVDQDLPRTTGWTHLKQLAVQEDRAGFTTQVYDQKTHGRITCPKVLDIAKSTQLWIVDKDQYQRQLRFR
ncbi:hypothetical protein B0O80DRAFT_502957 [Mortierella sp. GBAus27b]|nr:hypothetical protein B0O80DRAFT_502957 [Mortierella sp. GBAus27b]